MTEWMIGGGALVFIGLVVLIWRLVLTLGTLAGMNTRSQDRQRHDANQLIERLLEKREARDGIEMARVHKIERMEQNRLDARVEEAATSPPRPAEDNRDDDEVCSPDQYEN